MIKTIILLGLTLHLFCVNFVIAQDLKISGNYQEANLKQVLDDVEQRYPVRFYYLDEWLPEVRISQRIEQLGITEMLNLILSGSDLSFINYDDDKFIVGKKSRLEIPGNEQYFLAKQAIGTQEYDNRFQVIAVGDSTGIGSSSLYQVKIRFIDTDEEIPLDGVAVYFEKFERTINSKADGTLITSLPAGIFQMEARRVGYEPFLCNVKVISAGELTLKLEQEAIELMEVVVSGEGPEERMMEPLAGIVSLTPKQIKEMPSFLGEADVIKTIQTLPGVTTIGEGAAGFFVRGGNIDQNLILQDGAIFSNASHALGFFSMFNPDLISQVQLYKGSIPAQYGGRLSSVLDVKLKGSDYQNTTISGGAGTVMSKLAIETPVVKDKISLLAGGRISYADWLLPVIKIPEIKESKAFFYDFNLKMSLKTSENGSVSIGYFQSFDRVNFQDEAGFEWSIKNISADWSQKFGPILQSNLKFAMGYSKNLNFDPTGVNPTELSNGLDFYKLKESIAIPLQRHQMVLGAEWVYYRPSDETLTTSNTGEVENNVPKDRGQEFGIYFNDVWDISEKLALSAGLRVSLFLSEEIENDSDNLHYSNIEPRFSLRYVTGSSSSFKLSYNRMSQYLHLLSNTTGVLPVDQWITSNQLIAPSNSNNFSIGYFRNFNNDNWESSAELFYRQMTNLIEYKDFADLVLNPQVEEEILQGDGKAYGFELFLKKNYGKVKGNMSYTFSRTFIKVPLSGSENTEDWFPAKFDRPHNVNLVMDWTVTRRSRFGLVFNFTSGRPITAPVSSYELGNVVVPHYSDRNEFRIPNYHRLDLSYTYKRSAVKNKRYQDSITFSLYNVYGRRNAFSVFFRKENNQPAQAYRLSVLGSVFPSITYTFEFK